MVNARMLRLVVENDPPSDPNISPTSSEVHQSTFRPKMNNVEAVVRTHPQHHHRHAHQQRQRREDREQAASQALSSALFGLSTCPSAAHVSAAKGVIAVMAWTKTKIAVAAVATVLFVGGAGTVTHRLVRQGSERVVLSTPAPTFERSKAAGEQGFGTVVDGDGKPVSNAEVIVGNYEQRAQLFKRPEVMAYSPVGAASARTGPDGKFALDPRMKAAVPRMRSRTTRYRTRRV